MADKTEATYFDYRHAANPLKEGLISRVPFKAFSAESHQKGGTRVFPLDASAELGFEGPATSPALSANFVRIFAGEQVELTLDATSQLLFVHQGAGHSAVSGKTLEWGKGDLMVLPAKSPAVHHARDTAVLYWVHDAPLLRYLGACPSVQRFAPTLYPRSAYEEKLRQVEADPTAKDANRLAVLLGNERFKETRTITPTLWAMFGLLPKGAVQKPHRHQSVALDFVVDCPEGCYTMIGSELDAAGGIKNGVRADWAPGSVFITPPGQWHSHHNEGDRPAHVLPIQDAGLHTFLRTLDIQYSRVDSSGRVYVSPDPG